MKTEIERLAISLQKQSAELYRHARSMAKVKHGKKTAALCQRQAAISSSSARFAAGVLEWTKFSHKVW